MKLSPLQMAGACASRRVGSSLRRFVGRRFVGGALGLGASQNGTAAVGGLVWLGFWLKGSPVWGCCFSSSFSRESERNIKHYGVKLGFALPPPTNMVSLWFPWKPIPNLGCLSYSPFQKNTHTHTHTHTNTHRSVFRLVSLGSQPKTGTHNADSRPCRA